MTRERKVEIARERAIKVVIVVVLFMVKNIAIETRGVSNRGRRKQVGIIS